MNFHVHMRLLQLYTVFNAFTEIVSKRSDEFTIDILDEGTFNAIKKKCIQNTTYN